MVRARKALGQHFLRHRPVLVRIAAAIDATAGDVVLEIGPGPGGLTAALLERGATVVAIERDARFEADLRRRFADRDFVLIVGDALTLDWPKLVAPWTSTGRRWLVAGNIPYNITSPLIGKALTPPWPASVTFLVQREVAERVVAAPGTRQYGALSIGVQVIAEAAIMLTVGAGAFVPRPRVDSALLRLVPRSDAPLARDEIAGFRRLVTSVFSYRRKRIGRAVREAFGLDQDGAGRLARAAAIDPDLRPEMIPPEGYVRLWRAFSGGHRGDRSSGS
jgi:16S rRNA (adenine1518-N6/adenine1519-N6)-dimethyltransferase